MRYIGSRLNLNEEINNNFNKLQDIENIKQLVKDAIDYMNNQLFCTEVIFKYGKTGMIQKCVEIAILLTSKRKYPEYNIYHPEDNSGKADIYSDVLSYGIEVKTTLGWKHKGKPSNIRWTNGTAQTSTENFLFIKGSILNNKFVVEGAWIGTLSYDEWKKKPDNSLYISRKTIKDLTKQGRCIQII